MATHSSLLAWRIPTDRGAWRSQTRLKQLNTNTGKRSKGVGDLSSAPTQVCRQIQDGPRPGRLHGASLPALKPPPTTLGARPAGPWEGALRAPATQRLAGLPVS